MRAIIVKYLSPTDTKGSLLKASDKSGNSITISYETRLSQDDNYKQAAIKLCDKMNWTGNLIMGWLNNDAVFIFDIHTSYHLKA